MKMYIIVRKDIEISVGKLMIHASHAVTEMLIQHGFIFESPYKYRFLTWYEDFAQTKIILQVKDLDALKEIYERIPKVLASDFPRSMVEDAGFYELKKGTVVCVGIGPLKETEAIDLGLKKLSLYS